MNSPQFLQLTQLDGNNAVSLRESIHNFGRACIGVMTRPITATVSDIGIVLLNAGMIHRSGPYRLYSELARRLAAKGFCVLRYDQAGLGDSQMTTLPTNERRLEEFAAAKKLIEQHTGIRHYLVAGICSGADDAFFLADDPHIDGAILIDGLAYRTPGFWLRYLLPRLINPHRIIQYLAKSSAQDVSGGLDDFRDFPTQNQAREKLARLINEHRKFLFIYTGGAYSYFNHADQFRQCFALNAQQTDAVQLAFWPQCDHTFYAQIHRQQLIDHVVSWSAARFTSKTLSASQ